MNVPFIIFVIFLTQSNSLWAKTADQTLFPACPVNHILRQFCCRIDQDTQYLFNEYKRPSNNPGFEKEFLEGWQIKRRVNFPYAKYSPDTTLFQHTDPSNVCRIVSVLTRNEYETIVQENLRCGSFNDTNPSIFWSYAKNARNNDARCPTNSEFEEVTGNIEKIALCTSTSIAIEAKYQTFTDVPFLIVYIAYGLCILSILMWYIYKTIQENYFHSFQIKRKHGRNLQWELEAGIKSLIEHEHQDFVTDKNYHPRQSQYSKSNFETDVHHQIANEDIIQTGYCNSWIGSSILTYFIVMSFSLNLLLMIIIADSYGTFSLPLMTPGETVLSVFMVVWFTQVFWYIGIVSVKTKIRNFFRLKTSLNDAQVVHMFKPIHSQVLLSDHSGISSFISKIESFILPKRQRGYQETVIVQLTCNGSKVLEFQHLRYIYSSASQRFIPGAVSLGKTYQNIAEEARGLSQDEYVQRYDALGPNSIEIEMPSIWTSIREEFFSFFYIYQIMCYYTWYYFGYWNMGIVMTIVVLFSAMVNIFSKRRMENAVVQMTRYKSEAFVLRNGEFQKVWSTEMVPGDVVQLMENWTLPCDMVIVKGATVCDESMLTGESMPVQKFCIPEKSLDVYDPLGYGKKHTLFSGTKVLSSGRKEEILAIVRATGGHTSKGRLIQSILWAIPIRFKYDEHLKVVIAFLVLYSSVACYFAINLLTSNDNLKNSLNAFLYSICVLSGILSPLLPVVITVGQINAAKRLEKMGIFSLNAKRITLSGKVRVFCFDKTGTLTKEGLDFFGCQPVNTTQNTFLSIFHDITDSNINPFMKYALASCHSVGSLNGELVGNQVEVKMFQATGWKLQEKEGQSPCVLSPNNEILQFVKRFEFDHHRMSMSVIMRHMKTNELYIFCKGSYEKIGTFSTPNTIPHNYTKEAESLARQGCYVLGIGMKKLPNFSEEELNELIKNRDQVEANLSMLGLILYRNELKQDTRDAILKLKYGNTRVVMITGDNAMCGVYIARASGMIQEDDPVILGNMMFNEYGLHVIKWTNINTNDSFTTTQIRHMVLKKDHKFELAVTGKAFESLIQTNDMKDLLLHIRIFSRMTPDGKVKCVHMHMEKGVVTGMCGDGGNDCGALRQAHVGIALSDAEASIVSPFTSKPKTITSVVDLCREGRCSVATSFASVKMLIMYGLISSTMRFSQYYYGVVLSEWCYILSDAFVLVGLSYVITLSRPLPNLGKQRPTSSLIGTQTIASIFGQEIINTVFLYIAINFLTSQSWYCPFSPKSVDLAKWWLLSDNALATCLFYCVIFQQKNAAFVFSFGYKYRQSVWRNYPFCALYFLLIALDIYLVLGPPSQLTDLFRIASSTNVVGLPDIPLSFTFRFQFFLIVVANMITVVIYEYVFVLGPIRTFFRKRFHRDAIPMKL